MLEKIFRSRTFGVALVVALCATPGLAGDRLALPDRYIADGADGTPVQVRNPVDGTVWSAWSYWNGSGYDLAVASLAEGDALWSAPTFFGAGDGIDQSGPAIVADEGGTVYLAFLSGADARLAALLPGQDVWPGGAIFARDVDTVGLHVAGSRLVVAFRGADGLVISDYPLLPRDVEAPKIGTQGIQEGPDVIDPLGHLYPDRGRDRGSDPSEGGSIYDRREYSPTGPERGLPFIPRGRGPR